MALFSPKASYLGVDLGTSTAKIVELSERKNAIELVTYAEANMGNLLMNPVAGEQDAIDKTIALLQQMMEKSGSTAKNVIAALPGGLVFSTVLMLPNIPEAEMEKAVRFAARDVVPADIDEMVIGWSRVGSQAHMQTDRKEKSPETESKQTAAPVPVEPTKVNMDQQIPVFVTAAPKDIVNRYIAVFQRLNMTLLALEVETFPLVRSLLTNPPTSTLLVDIGAHATTFHIIDKGIPRVSQTIEVGGFTEGDIEKQKIEFGILPQQDPAIRTALEATLAHQAEKAKELLAAYEQKEKHRIEKSVLIGGGANLKGLPEYWGKAVGLQAIIGNPWKDVAYPKQLEETLKAIGPRYGVSVGLALRGFAQQ
ncbi:MAG: pilus assembly protein PilM [Candidatus Andersenbacteria bacterium]|nr:pilus assembly protein PilM [Candidatus Andersenbacteria bacterium]